jgi:hypothetical protein
MDNLGFNVRRRGESDCNVVSQAVLGAGSVGPISARTRLDRCSATTQIRLIDNFASFNPGPLAFRVARQR